MKKFISTIAIIAALCSLTACNGDTKSHDSSVSDSSQSGSNSTSSESSSDIGYSDSKPTEVALKDIEAAIVKALGDGYLCTEDVPEDEILLSCIGWLDMDKIDEYIVKQPAVFAQDCVGIVKCKDGYADEAVKTLNERFAQNISYIRQYPFDVAKVEGTRIYKVGNIVMYITAGAAYEGDKKEEEAKLAAAEYVKIDNVMKELFGSVPENLAVMPKEEENNGGFNFNEFDSDSGFVIGG